MWIWEHTAFSPWWRPHLIWLFLPPLTPILSLPPCSHYSGHITRLSPGSHSFTTRSWSGPISAHSAFPTSASWPAPLRIEIPNEEPSPQRGLPQPSGLQSCPVTLYILINFSTARPLLYDMFIVTAFWFGLLFFFFKQKPLLSCSFPESEFQVGLTAWIFRSGSPHSTVQVSTQARVSSETGILIQDHDAVDKIHFLQL